jgi:hypothetical protein
VPHQSELSPATRRRLVLACYALGAVLTAGTSLIRRAGPATTAIGVLTIADQQSGRTWSTMESPDGWLVRYGFPQEVWTVHTPRRGTPERRLHPVSLVENWLAYTGLVWGGLAALWWLRGVGARRSARRAEQV